MIAQRALGLVRRVLPRHSRVGKALRAARVRLFPPPPLAPGAEPLPAVLAEWARAQRRTFFVQIGSNDGEQLDPLRALIRERGWSGIMVEPVPFIFERLRRNYGDVPGVTLENVAIDVADGSRPLYYLPPSDDPGLPPWYDSLGSFDRDVVLKHREFIPDIDERIASLDVPCLSFDSLCRRHGVERIDLVHIDTEGHDFEILELIDLDRRRPAIVLFEHLHLDAATHRASIEHVGRHGYETLSNAMDTLCLRVRTPSWRDRHVRRLWRSIRNDPPPGIL